MLVDAQGWLPAGRADRLVVVAHVAAQRRANLSSLVASGCASPNVMMHVAQKLIGVRFSFNRVLLGVDFVAGASLGHVNCFIDSARRDITD